MITHSRFFDWVVCKTTYKLSVFFKIEKNVTLRFLSCCTRFIEHWFVLIGWSESRTASARLVLKTYVALHCGYSYWSWVQFSSCVCCVQVFTVPWARVSTPSTSAFGRQRSTASPFVVLPRHLFTNCQRRQLLQYTYDPLRRQLRLSYYYYYYYYYYLYPDLPSSVGQELRGSTDAHTRSAVEMSGTVQKNFNTDRLACYIPENTQQTSLWHRS